MSSTGTPLPEPLAPILRLLASADPADVVQGLGLLRDIDPDGALHDALVGPTRLRPEGYQAHSFEVVGPLASICNRSVTVYDGLYDTDITDDYCFPQVLLEVLAHSPGGRSAAWRDTIERLELRYTPPTTQPDESLDLRPLRAFPALRWLRLGYPARHPEVLPQLPLTGLSLLGHQGPLQLPAGLHELELDGTFEADFDLARAPGLHDLSIKREAVLLLRGADALSHLSRLYLTHTRHDCPFTRALPALLDRSAAQLRALFLWGADRVTLGPQFGALRNLTLHAHHIELASLPDLEELTLRNARGPVGALPGLHSARLTGGRSLAFLRDAHALTTLHLEQDEHPFTDWPELPALQTLHLRGFDDFSQVPFYPSATRLVLHRDGRHRRGLAPGWLDLLERHG